MGNYTVLESRGNPITADQPLSWYIYPDSNSEENLCESPIRTALTHALDQLYDYSAIDYYDLNINYDHPNVSYSSRGDYLTKFNNWLDSKGYSSYAGTHLAVENGFYGGKADNGTGVSSFNSGRAAVAGVSLYVYPYIKNTVIHEALHPTIDEDLFDVWAMLSDGDDHDLGKVYGDGSISPIATSYDDSHARHGECTSNAVYLETYKTELTDCTKEAVKVTANEYS